MFGCLQPSLVGFKYVAYLLHGAEAYRLPFRDKCLENVFRKRVLVAAADGYSAELRLFL